MKWGPAEKLVYGQSSSSDLSRQAATRQERRQTGAGLRSCPLAVGEVQLRAKRGSRSVRPG